MENPCRCIAALSAARCAHHRKNGHLFFNLKQEDSTMTKADLQKFEIIKSLWKIVKTANNTDIANADLSEGIADGETPEENVEEIVKDFKRFFGLYAGLAVEALKSGLYLDDHESYEADDWSGAFNE
jgi:hypothetical protein